MPSSDRPQNFGHANNSSWNDSGFAFAPNTNTMDAEAMPSDQAAAARAKAAEIMAAVRAGDMEKANATMGKSEAPGQLLPGMSWLKKKVNKRQTEKEAKNRKASVDDSASEYSDLKIDVKTKSG